ncbi:MAG: TetR/AcrR family transcriptional regulator [Pseudoclavibacter sp.]
MTTQSTGLRERKKRATRDALRTAALRLALDRGPENVRVDEIADAAGVSLRTYNNYFSSKEQAIVAAINAEREEHIVAAILAGPRDNAPLSEVVIKAVVEQYATPDERARETLMMVTTNAALRSSYADSVAMSERAVSDAFIERAGTVDPLTARVLAAAIGAAARIALQDWLRPVDDSVSITGFVVPSGPLADRMRAALMPLAPALDAAVGDASARTAPPST